MAVKIRLMRIGTKKRPFYRVVAVDERKKRTGAYIELLGTYNPLTEPKEILLQQDKIDMWVKKGAQMSTGVLRILGKNPQKPPRKPRKAPQETAAPVSAAPQAADDVAPAEESTPNEEVVETPVEVAAENAPQAEADAPQAEVAEVTPPTEVAEATEESAEEKAE
jgi:small subunit ribosomal protein S16